MSADRAHRLWRAEALSRECLAIDVAGGIRSGRVIQVLSRLVTAYELERPLTSTRQEGASSQL